MVEDVEVGVEVEVNVGKLSTTMMKWKTPKETLSGRTLILKKKLQRMKIFSSWKMKVSIYD